MGVPATTRPRHGRVGPLWLINLFLRPTGTAGALVGLDPHQTAGNKTARPSASACRRVVASGILTRTASCPVTPRP